MIQGARAMIWRRRGDLWLLSARWATPLFGLVGGLIAARYLMPEEFGVVQAVMLIPVYSNFLHFGVFNGLNRNLPLYKATGDEALAQAYVDASSKTAKWVAFAGAFIGLSAVGIFLVKAGDPLFAYVALYLVPGLFFTPRSLHLETVYRGTRHFEPLGKVIHLRNLWLFMCSLSTAFIGVSGLALKIGTQGLFGFLGLYKRVPVEERGPASLSKIKDLSAVGFPMMISGILFSWLVAADKTVISTFMGAKELGYFALASMAMNAIQVFPNSINQLLYPRVAHTFGKTGSSKSLGRYVWIGLGLNFLLLLPIVLVGWFLIPVLVNAFLPQYSPGIGAARIAIVGSLFFAYMGPSVIIPIVRKNFPFQIAAGLAIGLVWIGGYVAVRLGYGIEGVAWARLIATAFLCLFVIIYVNYLVRSDIRTA